MRSGGVVRSGEVVRSDGVMRRMMRRSDGGVMERRRDVKVSSERMGRSSEREIRIIVQNQMGGEWRRGREMGGKWRRGREMGGEIGGIGGGGGKVGGVSGGVVFV